MQILKTGNLAALALVSSRWAEALREQEDPWIWEGRRLDLTFRAD